MKKTLLSAIVFLIASGIAYGAIPHTFTGLTGPIPLSYLDDDFTYVMSGLPNITIGTTAAQSAWTGSVIQVGPNVSGNYSLTFPVPSQANLSLIRSITANDVRSHGLDIIVTTPTSGYAQSAVGQYIAVINRITGTGSTDHITGVGSWIEVDAYGTSSSYGLAINMNDHNGTSPMYGHHVAFSRKTTGSYITLGFEAQANESKSNSPNDFTAAYIVDTDIYSNQVKWGNGFVAVPEAIGQYGFVLTPFSSLGVDGSIAAPIWGVNPYGVCPACSSVFSQSTGASTWTSVTGNGLGSTIYTASGGACEDLNTRISKTTYSTVGYFKDPNGVVHLKGHVSCTSQPKYIFSVGAGYYAAKTSQVSSSCAGGDTTGNVTICGTAYATDSGCTAAGQVFLSGCAAVGTHSLDGVTFAVY